MLEEQVSRESQKTERITIPVEGLNCGGGTFTLERVLQDVAGVQHVYVYPDTEMIYVGYAPALCSVASLQDAINRAGFRTGPPILR